MWREEHIKISKTKFPLLYSSSSLLSHASSAQLCKLEIPSRGHRVSGSVPALCSLAMEGTISIFSMHCDRDNLAYVAFSPIITSRWLVDFSAVAWMGTRNSSSHELPVLTSRQNGMFHSKPRKDKQELEQKQRSTCYDFNTFLFVFRIRTQGRLQQISVLFLVPFHNKVTWVFKPRLEARCGPQHASMWPMARAPHPAHRQDL